MAIILQEPRAIDDHVDSIRFVSCCIFLMAKRQQKKKKRRRNQPVYINISR